MGNSKIVKSILTLTLSVVTLATTVACENKRAPSSQEIVEARVEVKKASKQNHNSEVKELIKILDQSHNIFDEVRNKIEFQQFQQSSVFKAHAKRLSKLQKISVSNFEKVSVDGNKTQWKWNFPSSEYKDFEVGISAKILSYQINCTALTEGKKLVELNCQNLSFNKGALEHVHLEQFKFNRLKDPAIVVKAFKYQNLTEKKSEVSVTVPLVGVIDYLEKEIPEPSIQLAVAPTPKTEVEVVEEPAQRAPPTVNTEYDENGERLPEEHQEEAERQAEVLSQT